MTEWQEQRALIEWAALMEKRYPALRWLFHIPNGEKRDRITAAKLKAMGVRAGVPDLCLPVPRKGYHGLYIELKAGTSRPSKTQQGWIAFLAGEGYLVKICYGFQEAASALLDYLRED